MKMLKSQNVIFWPLGPFFCVVRQICCNIRKFCAKNKDTFLDLLSLKLCLIKFDVIGIKGSVCFYSLPCNWIFDISSTATIHLWNIKKYWKIRKLCANQSSCRDLRCFKLCFMQILVPHKNVWFYNSFMCHNWMVLLDHEVCSIYLILDKRHNI